MIGTDDGLRRRRVLAATGAVVTGVTAGCLGSAEVNGRRDAENGLPAGASETGRCYTEAQSDLDQRLATVENVGILDGELFVELDAVTSAVASYRVFREDNPLETFDVGGGSRLTWPVPDGTFETSYRLVLRDESTDRLGSFAFSAECSSE